MSDQENDMLYELLKKKQNELQKIYDNEFIGKTCLLCGDLLFMLPITENEIMIAVKK